MNTATGFLNAFAQALSTMGLYPEGHQRRERVLDTAFEKLQLLLSEEAHPSFSFLGDEVVYQERPLRELRDWDWSSRMAGAGMQRLQFDESVTRDELEEFLDTVLARLSARGPDTTEARQMRPGGIRFGTLGIRGAEDAAEDVLTATIALTLREEAETIRWLHAELSAGRSLPLSEAEAVVRALSVAMHGDQAIMLPLLTLRNFDEYTTTHSLNVCVLAMAAAEWLGLGGRDVRSCGVAGLLHDLGKVKVPIEVLTKPGKLTPQERTIMNNHPVEGARLILASDANLDLAAVVAYEHHIMLNGGGYPKLTYDRPCHHISKLVHVCDVYDALRTKRPYRDAWPSAQVLAYLEERSGTEFDGELAHAFTQMMREWEPRVTPLLEDEPLPDIQPSASSTS